MTASKRERARRAAARSSRARRRPGPTASQNRESDLKVIYGDGCWCGKPFGHGWAGKADGKPHPR